jgi:hypothetical protein
MPAAALAWAILWALYLSFVNVGQTFYGFIWETLLLETGFIAIFAGGARTPPNMLVIWMWRWILFRVMVGAGLIKLRGDPCWRNLTCLQDHFETQPIRILSAGISTGCPTSCTAPASSSTTSPRSACRSSTSCRSRLPVSAG